MKREKRKEGREGNRIFFTFVNPGCFLACFIFDILRNECVRAFDAEAAASLSSPPHPFFCMGHFVRFWRPKRACPPAPPKIRGTYEHFYISSSFQRTLFTDSPCTLCLFSSFGSGAVLFFPPQTSIFLPVFPILASLEYFYVSNSIPLAPCPSRAESGFLFMYLFIFPCSERRDARGMKREREGEKGTLGCSQCTREGGSGREAKGAFGKRPRTANAAESIYMGRVHTYNVNAMRKRTTGLAKLKNPRPTHHRHGRPPSP